METTPSHPEPPPEPVPAGPPADPSSFPGSDPHEAFTVFEIFLHHGFQREEE